MTDPPVARRTVVQEDVLATADVKYISIDRNILFGFFCSLLLFLIGQVVAGVWWASQINTRMEQVERLSREQGALPERVAKLETMATSVAERLGRIDTKLDQLISITRDSPS